MWSRSQNFRLFLCAFFILGCLSLSANEMDFNGSCPAAVRSLREEAARVQPASAVARDPQQRSLFERQLGQGPKKPAATRSRPSREVDRVEISNEARMMAALSRAAEILRMNIESPELLNLEDVMNVIKDFQADAEEDMGSSDSEERQDARLLMSQANEALQVLKDAGVIASN